MTLKTLHGHTQMDLGELIYALECCEIEDDTQIRFDFAYFVPKGIHSWRGSYEQVAIGYCNPEEYKDNPLVKDFLLELKSSIGEEFYGWKGGCYSVTREKPLWVAESNESCNTAIIGVHDAGYFISLLTDYCEY